jgi:hypothetical protein
MPILMLTLGIVAVVTAINGSFKQFVTQLESDLTGQFFNWLLAVFAVGLIGYIPGWEKPSRLFLALIIIALIFSNQGVIAKLQQAIGQGAKPNSGTPLASIDTAPAIGSTQPGSSVSGGSSTGSVGSIGGISQLQSGGLIPQVAATLATNLPTSVAGGATAGLF